MIHPSADSAEIDRDFAGVLPTLNPRHKLQYVSYHYFVVSE